MASHSLPPNSNDAIRIHYGSLALQFGIGNVPNLFLRFHRYLVHTSEDGSLLRLSDAEAMLLVHVMALRSDDDFELRLSNLPMIAPLRTRVDYLGKLRRMGLVFTSRLYYSRAEMLAYYGAGNLPPTPRMRAQQWDLSSLIYNLSLVAQEYLHRQRQAVTAWQKAGEAGPRPVTELSADYRHEIGLPDDVAANIRAGVENPDKATYFPVPDEWKQRACAPTEKAPVRDDVPTDLAQVQAAYLRDFSRSSMLTSVLTPAGAGGPSGGPSDAASQDSSSQHSAAPPFPLGLNQLQTPDASSGAPTPASLPPAIPASASSPREPMPAWRARVIVDLKAHANRRLQIGIVTKNIGLLLGFEWTNGVLRTMPETADYAEVGQLVREFGGPFAVWKMACKVAGHEIDGRPMDYLRAALQAARESSSPKSVSGTHANRGQVFEGHDYSRYRTSNVQGG